MTNMKKRFVSIILMAVLALTLGLTGCKTETTVNIDASAVDDAIAEYLVNEVGKYYDKADVCIPVIHNLSTNIINNDATAYGDYWVENYDIKGDTLEFVSGGNYPGVFKLKINEKGDMVVTDFQSPEDGEGYADSAKKLFGKYYEDFANYSADDKAKKEVRTKAIAEYVKANGLKVTQYHDYGWDPVALPTK